MSLLSVLIAEDEVLTRMAVKEILIEAGYFICAEAGDGETALDLATKLMPDLAILDIKMPYLNGLEVASALHNLNIPVILLTAYSQTNFVKRAEKVNVYGYLVKPITGRELLPAVQIAYARWKDMESKCKELSTIKEKFDNQKVIAHGKALLAQNREVSEYQAHQVMVQYAMSSRKTLLDVANILIKNEGEME